MNDLTSQKFGRLLVIKKTEKRTKSYIAIWLCRCDYGNLVEVRSDNLKSGNSKSCGCLDRDVKTKHGDWGKNLYRIWLNIKNRCYNPKGERFHRYGGRGIQMCQEWKENYLPFKKWALANGYRVGLSIDRIDNDGDYTPENCQWLTMSENAIKNKPPRNEHGKFSRVVAKEKKNE